MTRNSSLSLDQLISIERKFIKKRWNESGIYRNFFEIFCSFLENLNREELDLIMLLMDEYEWVTDTQYFNLLIESFNKIFNYVHLDLSKVYILPLLSKEDREKNKDKSSKLVAYMFKSTALSYVEKIKDVKFQLLENLDKLPSETRLNKHPMILVDDFVGTGETAINAIEELFDNRSYKKENVFVLSLVLQERGFKAIQSKGLEVLHSKLIKRGISDRFDDSNKNRYLEIMDRLEKKLKVKEDFKYGYKKSEALITMINTPNNTFPIYWYSGFDNTGKKWKAPFERK